MNSKNTFFFSILFSIVIVAKTAYTFATNDALIFILKPISKAVSLVSNVNFQYANEFGFYFEELNITIDKSCSGINFWLISFVVFATLLVKICNSNFQKIIVIPLSLLATYILTLFANTSRILTSIFIEKQTNFNYSWLHQAEGVFIYLSFLILVYMILNYTLTKYYSHDEKLT
ncbi:exosortase K [Winogradskyella schleiferi]|uniref:exosortase K n=1 Tax=Winogradskyella schleiferi TaxID=2686078 RepID=UPI0015BE196F|nr:exosortase K [Winogradskyella schleiferi]